MNFLKNLLLALALSLPLYATAGEPVNINTADAAAIADNLNGIGDAGDTYLQPLNMTRAGEPAPTDAPSVPKEAA